MNKSTPQKELIAKSEKELLDLLRQTRTDLSKQRFQVAINKEKNVKSILLHRKQIARILSLLKTRQSDAANAI
jgi:ribosomal protein L29